MKKEKVYSRYETKEYKQEIKHKAKMRKIEERGEKKLRKQELKAKRDSYKSPRKKIQTSKIIAGALMILLLLNCLVIEAYSCYAMLVLQDLSALYVLIGAACTTVIGEVLSYGIYSLKAYAETKSEKNLEFEYHKFNAHNDDSAVG